MQSLGVLRTFCLQFWSFWVMVWSGCTFDVVKTSWRNTKQSKNYFEQNLLSYFYVLEFSSRLVRKILTEKEFKATMTIFLVCFAFFVCVTLFMICHFLSDFGISFQVGTFFTCLYWLQYCINFFIYILRSEQYRKAYLILFRKVNSIEMHFQIFCQNW